MLLRRSRSTSTGRAGRRRVVAIRRVAVIPALVVAAAGCGGGDDSATDTTTTVGGAVTSPPVTTSATDVTAAATTIASTTTSTTEPAPTTTADTIDGLDGCVVGHWRLDNDSYAAAVEAIGGYPAVASGENLVNFWVGEPDGETGPTLLFGESHVDFETTFSFPDGDATMSLTSFEVGRFETVRGDAPGSGVLIVGQLLNLGESFGLDADDVSLRLADGRLDIDLPEISISAPVDDEPADGWEQPRPYRCTPTELLLGDDPLLIRYLRVG